MTTKRPVVLTDAEVATLLRRIAAAIHYWREYHGYVFDRDEYYDTAMAALIGCLERYDRGGETMFLTYAYHRIEGALRDVPVQYWRWHNGWAGKGNGTRRRTHPVRHRVAPATLPPSDLYLRSRLRDAMPTCPVKGYDTMRGHAPRYAVACFVRQIVEAWSVQELADREGVTYLSMQTYLACVRAALRPRLRALWEEWRHA